MKKSLSLFIFIICVSLITGCSRIIPLFKEKEPAPVSNLSASSILFDQEIRTQTVQLIHNAKKAIFIQLSSLEDEELQKLLVSRSQSGIEVRILLDQWQRENSATVKYLKNNNISVQYYPAQKGQYQRIRYMVVDYQTAVFYGGDWTKRGFGAHTMAVKLTGDTAWTMVKSFYKDWLYTTTLDLELPEQMELPEDHIIFTINSGVKQQILNNITSATSEIIAQVEQLSYPDTVQALVEAKQRGCNIRLIVSPSCAVATPNTIKKFIETGIEIRYYSHPNNLAMGFNLGVFDNKTIIMSSSSWTYNSFVINHEGLLSIPSPAAVEKIKSVFEQEWKRGTTP